MHKQTAETVLANHPILDGAPSPVLRGLLVSSVTRRVEVGQVLCGAHARTGRVWFVAQGLLQSTIQSRRGSPVTIEVLRDGEAFGYLNCWMQEPHVEEVSGLVPSVVVGVPAERFLAFVQDHAPASAAVLRETAERMRSLVRLRAISTEPASARVRSVLAFLHDKMGPTIPMTREMIAMVAGLTTETVSRSMAPLARRGIVDLRRGAVEILAPERLS